MHRCAQERLPAASCTQTDPEVQHTEPHACATSQHAPPTHVRSPVQEPAGFAGLHGEVGVMHTPPEHVCPPGQTPVGLAALQGCGPVAMHMPPTHACPTGHVPLGLAALHPGGVPVQSPHAPKAVPSLLHTCRPVAPPPHAQLAVTPGVQMRKTLGPGGSGVGPQRAPNTPRMPSTIPQLPRGRPCSMMIPPIAAICGGETLSVAHRSRKGNTHL